MVIFGQFNMGDVPFHNVYIHPVIQDGNGQRMSKSAGNGIDPVDIIDLYGADALRFTLASSATETQDIRIPVEKAKLPDGREVNTSERFEQARTFPNKVWNASRFALMNLEGYEPPRSISPTCRRGSLDLEPAGADDRRDDRRPRGLPFRRGDQAAPRLHLERLLRLVRRVPQRTAPRSAARPVAQRVLAGVLDGLCRLLHPIVPFLTEQIWQALGRSRPSAGFPNPSPPPRASASPPGRATPRPGATRGRRGRRPLAGENHRDPEPQGRAERPRGAKIHADPILAEPAPSPRSSSGEVVHQSLHQRRDPDHRARSTDRRERRDRARRRRDHPAAGSLIDKEAEAARLRKSLADLEKQLPGVQAKLSNEAFLSRAPAEVVEQQAKEPSCSPRSQPSRRPSSVLG